MRFGRRLPFALGAVVACVAAVGCGKSTPTTPSTVQLSLTAPVDGARIDVRNVLVLGTVAPQNATVTVAGRHVRVSNGTFRRWVTLRAGVTRIAVSAAAPGLIGSALNVSVRSGSRRVPIPHSPRNALQEFLNKANQTCSRAVVQLDGFDFAHIDVGVTPAVALRRANLAAHVGAQLVKRLHTIHAPQKQAAGYAAFLAGADQFVGQLNNAVAVGGSGQTGAALSLINNADASLGALISQGEALELFLCTGGLH